MSYGAEAADQIVKYSIDGVGVIVKGTLTGSTEVIKRLLAMVVAITKGTHRTKGKVFINTLCKQGDGIAYCSVDSKKFNLDDFRKLAKQHGIIYAVAADKTRNGIIEILCPEKQQKMLRHVLEDLMNGVGTVTCASINTKQPEKTRNDDERSDEGPAPIKEKEMPQSNEVHSGEGSEASLADNDEIITLGHMGLESSKEDSRPEQERFEERRFNDFVMIISDENPTAEKAQNENPTQDPHMARTDESGHRFERNLDGSTDGRQSAGRRQDSRDNKAAGREQPDAGRGMKSINVVVASDAWKPAQEKPAQERSSVIGELEGNQKEIRAQKQSAKERGLDRKAKTKQKEK